MADTSRTVKVRFDGSATALGVASKQAEQHLESYRKQTESVDKSLTRIFTTGTKATLALGSVGGAVPILAGVAASTVAASGALLVLPGAALAGAAAYGVLKLATTGFGDAVSAADPAAFAEATKEMAPAAIETATALRGLRPEVVALRQEVQQRFFAGFADDARQLGGTYLPVLRPQLAGISGEFNLMGREAVRALMAPASVTAVNSVLGDTRGIVGDLRPALGNVLTGVLAIGGQGTAEFRGFGASVTDVTARFRDWATEAAKSGRITELIREGKGELRAWGDVAGNVGGILGTIFDGITDDQGNFADGLVETTQALEDFLNTAEGQGALQALGETLRVTADVARTVLMAALRELGPVIVESAPAAQEFARVLGVILVDAIQTVGPMVQDLARFLSENRDVIGTVVPILAGLVLGFKALSIIQSVAGWVGGAATAIGGLGAAAGPVGIAVGIAAAAVYVFTQRQNDAAAAARAHDGAIATLKGTLDEYTGAVTAATVAETSKDIAERKLTDGTTTFAKALRHAGITFVDYTNAASGNAEALAEVNSQLFTAAQRTPGLQELYARWKPRLDEAGVSFDTFTAAAIGNGGAFDELTTKVGASGSGIELWRQDLARAVGPVGELGSALGEYNSVLTEAQEQTRQAAEVSNNFHTILETVKAGLLGLKDGAAPLPPMVAAFTDLGGAAEVAAEAAAKSAAQFGGVSAGAEAARRSMEESRSSFIASATAAGLTADEANRLADQIGLIPAVAETRFETNAAGVAAELQELNAQFGLVPDAKSITVNALTDEARARLEELGFKVTELPNGQVLVEAQTDAARGKLDELVAYGLGLITVVQVDANPDPATGKITSTVQLGNGSIATMMLDALPDPATGKINGTVQYGNGQTATITLDGNPNPATGKVDGVVTYGNGQTARIQVDANTAAANAAIDHAARTRNTRINVTYFVTNSLPSNGGGTRPVQQQALGGLLRPMASGGHLSPMRGGIAQVVPPNTWRIIGDRLRGDEFYIPDDESLRSLSIGAEWARRRGFALMPRRYMQMASGGLLGGSAVATPAPTAMATGDTYVTVILDGEPIRATVRREIDTANRQTARGVRVGAGVTY
jgi:hypothetical protein